MLALKISPHALSRFVVYGALPPTVLLRTVDGLETKPLGESNLALSLFGAVGIVLGPALLALLRALLDLYSEEYSNIERP